MLTMEEIVTAYEKLAKALADANVAIARLHLPNPPNLLLTPSTSTKNNRRPLHWSAINPDQDLTG